MAERVSELSVFRGGGRGGENLEDLVEAGELQAQFDHAGASGEAQFTAGGFEFGETANDGADGGTIDVGDFGKIKNDEGAGAGELLDFLLEAAAVRPGVNAALEMKDGDAGLRRIFAGSDDHDGDSPS